MTEEHFGKFLRNSIERLGLRKKDAAEKIGVEDVTLRSWFNRRVPHMRPENHVKVAKLLGLSIEELEVILVKAMTVDPKIQKLWTRQLQEIQKAGGKINDQIAAWERLIRSGHAEAEVPGVSFDLNPADRVFVPEIPTFKLAVAAGPWTEVGEIAELHNPAQIDDGRFRIWIAGDSMEPTYHDGALIEFLQMRWGGDDLHIGRDYYVQRADYATFKRLEKMDEEKLVFRAINRKKYPDAMPVQRGQVLRMARAEYILTAPK